MARPRRFDENTVLDQAMLLFWEKGFTATSMQDIQAATGLKPGSLYDSFGDKHHLFLKAVDHYRSTIVRKRLLRLTQPGTARERLSGFFDDLIEFSLGDGRKLGCLMSNTAVERAAHNEDCRSLVQDNLVEIASAFCQVIEEGKKNGDVTTQDTAEDIARFLVNTVQGLRVMAKSQASEETLRTSVRLALKALD